MRCCWHDKCGRCTNQFYCAVNVFSDYIICGVWSRLTFLLLLVQPFLESVILSPIKTKTYLTDTAVASRNTADMKIKLLASVSMLSLGNSEIEPISGCQLTPSGSGKPPMWLHPGGRFKSPAQIDRGSRPSGGSKKDDS